MSTKKVRKKSIDFDFYPWHPVEKAGRLCQQIKPMIGAKVEKITTTYRGQEITFRETDEKWACDIVPRGDLSLAALKKKIDKHLKEENTYTNTQAILLVGYGRQQMVSVTITSVTEDGEVWVRREKDKGREKISRSRVGSLVKTTPKNEQIIASIKAHEEVILKNQETVDGLTASLERVFLA